MYLIIAGDWSLVGGLNQLPMPDRWHAFEPESIPEQANSRYLEACSRHDVVMRMFVTGKLITRYKITHWSGVLPEEGIDAFVLENQTLQLAIQNAKQHAG